MAEHRGVVVPDGALASRAATLICEQTSAGQPVVVLYGGAVGAAEITIELQLRDPGLLVDGGPVEFVHHGGGSAALRAAAGRTGQHSDAAPCLIAVHPLGRRPIEQRGPCAGLGGDVGSGAPPWSLTVCLFDAVNAVTAGLGDLAGHPVVTVDDVELGLQHPEGRVLAFALLLDMLDEPSLVHQLAATRQVTGLERTVVDRLVRRRLASLRSVSHPASSPPPPPVTSEETYGAVLATDGRIDELLRIGQDFGCPEILVENVRFEPLAWFPRHPRPRSLSELITGGRLARLAGRLKPAVPEVIRLGAPSAGQRLVMRIGATAALGFVSVEGVRSDAVERASGWLRHLTPLVAAELIRRESWDSLRSESRGQLITLLVHGLLSEPSALLALDALIGSGDARVAAVRATSPHGVAPTAESDPRQVIHYLDQLRVPYGEYHGQTVTLLRADAGAADQLAASLSRLPVAVGFGSVAAEPGELPTSARQATWTCRMALATRQPLLDFTDIGIYRLFLPGAEGGDHGFEQPIERLELLHHELGFDPVHTLTGYLDAGGNMRRAADQMAIHVNTLRYRLGRITKIIEVDLADPEQRFRLQLAVRLRAGRRALQDADNAQPSFPSSRPPGSGALTLSAAADVLRSGVR